MIVCVPAGVSGGSFRLPAGLGDGPAGPRDPPAAGPGRFGEAAIRAGSALLPSVSHEFHNIFILAHKSAVFNAFSCDPAASFHALPSSPPQREKMLRRSLCGEAKGAAACRKAHGDAQAAAHGTFLSATVRRRTGSLPATRSYTRRSSSRNRRRSLPRSGRP